MKFFTYVRRVIPEVESSIVLSKNFLENLGVTFNVLVNENELFHLIKKCDGSEVSKRPFFESDLPCFDSDLPYLQSDLPIFWVIPSHFSNQSFPIFQVRSHFFGVVLPQIISSHFSSQTFPFFPFSPFHFSKSVLLIFWLRTSIFTGQSFQPFKVSPSYFSSQTFLFFWVSPSHFSSQTFPFFRVSPSHFPKSTLLICRVRPSHFYGSVLPTFQSQSRSFFEQDLPIFLGQFFSFLESDLPILSGQSFSFFGSDLLFIFFAVSFRLLSVLCSDLIAMSTVDKINGVGVCRKCLRFTKNSLARETNQQNTIRQARKWEK